MVAQRQGRGKLQFLIDTDKPRCYDAIVMKRFLTTLLLPALLFAAPVALSQEDSPAAKEAAAPNPAGDAVPLYPEKLVKKKLKMGNSRDTILPYGILYAGKDVMVLSGLSRAGASSIRQDLVLSSSKDGSSWKKVGVIIPQTNLKDVGLAGMGAICDTVRNQIVLLYCETPGIKEVEQSKKKNAKDAPLDLNESYKFRVAIGKAGKFSKTRDITKQFEAKRRTEEDFRMDGQGIQFQGICLTRGEHRGRLLFLAAVSAQTVCSIYSDDCGRTWKTGNNIRAIKANITGIGSGLNLCEADDGSVLCFCGVEGQKPQWMSSEDGGTTWQERQPAQGQVASYPGRWANAYIILNSRDADGNGSRLLSVATIDKEKGLTHVALSYDWGKTWPHQKTIESALLVTRNNVPVQPVAPGIIGMITTTDNESFQHNGLESATFTTFSLSWLTDGKDDGIGEVKD